MAEYIDKAAAIKLLTIVGLVASALRRAVTECIRKIELMPAADVEPVVRCKDCQNSYEGIDGRICSFGPCVDCVVPDDSFCSLGERRMGDD